MLSSRKICMSALIAGLSFSAADAAPLPSAQREALNTCVVQAAGEMHFNGSVYLALPGDLVVAKNFGTADAAGEISIDSQTRFNIASAGKMFTAVSIGILAERRRIEFDAPIGRYLQGLDPQFAAITIRQLLQHRSGLGDYFTPTNIPTINTATTATDLLPLALATPPAFAPGSKMAYSNSGYIVLGAIIEKISGVSYVDFVQREILTPLGMANTRATPIGAAVPMTRMSLDRGILEHPQPAPMQPLHASPAGGMFSTASDMSRFLTALADNRLVKAETLTALFPQRSHPPARIGHNGGTPGANAEIWFYPDSSWQLIALSNYDPPVATRMATVLEQAMLAADVTSACATALSAPPPQMPMQAPRQ